MAEPRLVVCVETVRRGSRASRPAPQEVRSWPGAGQSGNLCRLCGSYCVSGPAWSREHWLDRSDGPLRPDAGSTSWSRDPGIFCTDRYGGMPARCAPSTAAPRLLPATSYLLPVRASSRSRPPRRRAARGRVRRAAVARGDRLLDSCPGHRDCHRRRQCPHRPAGSFLTERVGCMVLVAGLVCLPVQGADSTRPRARKGPGPSRTGVFGRLNHPPVAAGQPGLRFVVTAVAAPPSCMRHGGHQDGPCALSPRAHPTRSPGLCSLCSLCKPLQSCSGQSSCGSVGVASL